MKDTLETGHEFIRALKHPLRGQIIEYLRNNPGSNVTSIYKHFDIEQSVASNQLGILRRANCVTTEKEQREVFYSVNEEAIQHNLNLLNQLK